MDDSIHRGFQYAVLFRLTHCMCRVNDHFLQFCQTNLEGAVLRTPKGLFLLIQGDCGLRTVIERNIPRQTLTFQPE